MAWCNPQDDRCYAISRSVSGEGSICRGKADDASSALSCESGRRDPFSHRPHCLAKADDAKAERAKVVEVRGLLHGLHRRGGGLYFVLIVDGTIRHTARASHIVVAVPSKGKRKGPLSQMYSRPPTRSCTQTRREDDRRTLSRPDLRRTRRYVLSVSSQGKDLPIVSSTSSCLVTPSIVSSTSSCLEPYLHLKCNGGHQREDVSSRYVLALVSSISFAACACCRPQESKEDYAAIQSYNQSTDNLQTVSDML